MRILVDGDSFHSDARALVLRRAGRLEIEVLWFTSTGIPKAVVRFSGLVEVRVPPGSDSVDDALVDRATKNDICCTRDIVLAGRLVEKGVCVINDRGTEFTRENIGERISQRDFMADVRLTGLALDPPRYYDKRDFTNFSNAFDRVLTRQRN